MVIWTKKYSVTLFTTTSMSIIKSSMTWSIQKNFNACAESNNWELPVIPSTVGNTAASPIVLGSMKLLVASQRFLKKNILRNGILPSLSWPWQLLSYMTLGMVPTPILLNISLIQTMKPLLRRLSKVLKRRFTKSCYKWHLISQKR